MYLDNEDFFEQARRIKMGNLPGDPEAARSSPDHGASDPIRLEDIAGFEDLKIDFIKKHGEAAYEEHVNKTLRNYFRTGDPLDDGQVRSVGQAEALARAVKARLREVGARFVQMLALLVAGIGVGGPVGYAIKEASVVERTVEKIVKVPVPGPPPKPVPLHTVCPRCGQRILVVPPGTGALPDEPAHEGPGRLPDAVRPDLSTGGVAVATRPLPHPRDPGFFNPARAVAGKPGP